MSGNVNEWVSDWYGAYPPGGVTDPGGVSAASDRVCRGGNWGNPAAYARVAFRSGVLPDIFGQGLGLRLARVGELGPPELTAEEVFGLITENLEVGNAAAARVVARRFLDEKPSHDRAGEAYYRIAESYQNEGEFKQAAVAFQDVLDKAGTSTWAPWSLLRQGECFEGLGQASVAEMISCDVIKKYPGSKAAKEATLKCPY